MVAINFMKQFADAVSQGNKHQTIRATTKAHTGCQLQFYTGMRTLGCRKIRPDARCKGTQQIVVAPQCVRLNDKIITSKDDLDNFAIADGFPNYDEMWKFFEPWSEVGGFTGWLITW